MMLIVTGMLAGVGSAAGRNGNRNQPQGPAVAPPAAASLTAEETANVLRMREEEKLARDAYRVFAELWKAPVFTNIAAAEQRHMDAMGLLIAKYGLTDPVTDDTVGVFNTPEFASLYASLTESGAKSLLDALKAAVQIEQTDIADLEKALAQTDKSDIQWVLGNLLRASSNHLRAFTRNVETGGTGCLGQGISGNAANGKGPGNGACLGCGCGNGGNGNCYRNARGNRNQSGMGRGNGQQKRGGACLMLNPVQP